MCCETQQNKSQKETDSGLFDSVTAALAPIQPLRPSKSQPPNSRCSRHLFASPTQVLDTIASRRLQKMNSDRRRFLTVVASGTLLAAAPASTLLAVPSNKTLLACKTPAGDLQRVVIAAEVEGELRLNADGKKVTSKPIRVLANYEFDEKRLSAGSDQDARAIRHYSKAEADIRVDRGSMKNTLRDDVRLIGIQAGSESATLYSPLGPLVRDELELLKVAGESIVWNRLLPATPVAIGDTWKPTDAALAMLLNIEVVTANEVQGKFVSVEDGLAMLELAGHLTGAIGGVGTEFELKAKLNFHQKQQRITWLAMGLKEKRAIGHAEPGFEITSRVRWSATPLSSSGYLTDKVLKDVPLEFSPGMTLLAHNSDAGGFQLMHDRRWQVMADHRDAAILRLIDNGDLIAQCNLSRLPDLPLDKRPALDAFQREVASTLGQNFGQFVDADQSTSDGGHRQLRIVVAGNVQEVPVQWTYYHLSDNEGRNAALVFTMDSSLVERFAELDRAMVSSLTLRSRKHDVQAAEPEENPQEAAEPTATKPAETSKK